MISYIIKRLGAAIPTLVGITVFVFLMIHLIPGNIVEVMLGTRTNISSGQIQELYRLYGINRPLWQQYLSWVWMLLHGNLGFSLRTGIPISELLVQSFQVTAELAVLSLLVAVLIAVPLGMAAAIYQGTWIDYLARVISLVGFAVPNFWLGTMLVLLAAKFATGFSSFSYHPLWQNPGLNLKGMALPVLALALSLMAIITRMTRSSVAETLTADHVRTARAKGLREHWVLIRHVLRNSLIPIVTIIGLQLGYLLGGAIIVENVFSLPGMGQVIVNAINQRDYPVVQVTVLFAATLFVMVNLVVDIVYAFIHPRIRYQ
ncbi:MAG: ABC transporter permease [Alicyclobacillus sp.]|nr:ABC transporter permease [Alicyclobacillus sp.]